ncbi:MAG: NHL repeat-containing protein [Deltaproteobacteria bacterium]|nr:NHL repeat-containing protein [Deltaproteobacteria bacterium]
MSTPTGVAVDASGNVYVTESSGGRLHIYNKFGSFQRELTGLNKPTGVAVDPWGRIYVSNTGSKSVDVYDGNLSPVLSLGRGAVQLIYPTAVAVDSNGYAFVADSKDHRIKVFDSAGYFLYSFGGQGSGDGNLNFPVSVTLDESAGEVIVSDLKATPTGYRGAGVQVFDRNGTFRRRFGGYGEGQGLFIRPMGVAVDGSGRIYVADSYQNVVQVFGSNGSFLRGVFDSAHPVRTPMGIAYCRATDRLMVASLNTGKLEVFGNTPQGGSGADSGGAPMTFSSSGGGGGCSMAVHSRPGGISAAGWIFPGVFLLYGWRRLRRKRKGIARTTR